MREAFESFYEDISGHKPYWWPETEDYSPKLASIAWEAWQAALQHAGQGEAARETLASWMLMRGFSTGHGDTIDDLLTELGGQIDDLLSAGKEVSDE